MVACTRATTARPARSATRPSTRTGRLCGCGNHGCLEAYVRADRIAEACGAATVDEVVVRARGGDAVALGVLAEMGRYLGIGLANVITILTPDRVVIGGGRAAALDLFEAPMRRSCARRVHDDGPRQGRDRPGRARGLGGRDRRGNPRRRVAGS